MPLSLLRIDDRLIHGQVVEGWLPVLKPGRVLIVSDEAAKDETQIALMEMAMPEEVGLEVLPVEASVSRIREAQEGVESLFVLAPGPAEVLALLESGLELDSVNVGGMHYAAGRYQLGKAIFLDEKDVRDMRSIAGHGVRLEGRAVPSDAPEDLCVLIEEARQ